MDILEFVVRLLGVLAWPLTVLVVVFVLRDPLRKLLPLLASLKYKDFEITFREQLKDIRGDVEGEVKGEVPKEIEDQTQKLIQLAETAPRSAVLEAWMSIELAVTKKVGQLVPNEPKRAQSARVAINFLENSGALVPSTVRALRQMSRMRNQAAHEAEFAVSSADSQEYVRLSQSIVRQIEAITELPKVNLTALTLLILDLNHLIDSGKYNDISITDIYREIERGAVLRFLKERCKEDVIILGLLLDTGTYPNFESYYEEKLNNIYSAYAGEEGKWAVRNLGLCLLLAWTNEIIQQGAGWHPNE